jgi:cyclopropane-fatty-acyl-phospholipid synthase
MIYSCAYFTAWDNDLDTAQRDKLDMICRKLRLRAGESFLDIGCGWGALVCHAAQHFGVLARGVTLSREQYTYANNRIAQAGLANRVAVELRDYTSIEAMTKSRRSVCSSMWEW